MVRSSLIKYVTDNYEGYESTNLSDTSIVAVEPAMEYTPLAVAKSRYHLYPAGAGYALWGFSLPPVACGMMVSVR